MIEMPEVFYAERPDPLEQDRVSRAAYMDAFVGCLCSPAIQRLSKNRDN
jgi:hypothetical protein